MTPDPHVPRPRLVAALAELARQNGGAAEVAYAAANAAGLLLQSPLVPGEPLEVSASPPVTVVVNNYGSGPADDSKLDALSALVEQLRADVGEWATQDRLREEDQMTTLDDLRTAQGNVATLVGAIGAEATAAANRITTAVANLQQQVQDGAVNDVAAEDVAALQAVEGRLRLIGDTIAAIGADPGTEVPPVDEVPPIDELPPLEPTEPPTEEPPVEEPPVEQPPTEEPPA